MTRVVSVKPQKRSRKGTRMLRTTLVTLVIGSMAAWGQAQNTPSSGADKVDRATAYYHYALAHMYAQMAVTSRGRNAEYRNEAIRNYEAALKADPRAPVPKRPAPLFPPLVPLKAK